MNRDGGERRVTAGEDGEPKIISLTLGENSDSNDRNTFFA